MALFLQIVGALVVAAIVLLIGGWFTLRWWLRRKLGAQLLAVLDHAESNGAPVVARITLGTSTAPPHHPDAVGLLIADFHRLGYRRIGRHAVAEMPGLQLWAGLHADGSLAIIYDHPAVGAFFDLVRPHADLTALTFSSTRLHNPDHVAPGCETIADPTTTPEQARAHLLARPGDVPLLEYRADNFVTLFEQAYARSMDYILARGAPQPGEIELNIEQFGGPHDLTEQQKAEALQRIRRDRLDALVDRFLESGQVDARQWQRVSDRVIVVHRQLSVDEAIDLALADGDDDDLEYGERLRARHDCPLQAFAAADARRDEHRRHVELGRIEQPVEARIYAAPA